MSIVFALATPAAKSAICVFRVSGEGCLSSLSKLVEKPLMDTGLLMLGLFISTKDFWTLLG